MSTSIHTSVLAEIDWDEGLSMPVANLENKKLENTVQKNQTQIVIIQNEVADAEDRISAMSEHLRNVRQELQHTQGLVNAREKELQTEDHILKLAEREEGRLKQEVSRLMKEMDELKEKKNEFENKIFRQTQKLEGLKAQMNWDQQTLEAWLEESTRKDEDAMTIQKYTRQDEGKIKELSSRMEKLMAEAMKKKHQLHMEITATTASQIEMDKIADDFRHVHIQREELLSQWENTIEQMQKRDREMSLIANKITAIRFEIRQKDRNVRENLQFLEHEKDNNAVIEKKISAEERVNAQIRLDLLQAESQKMLFENETNTLKRTVDRTALDLEITRSAITHLKKDITEKSVKLKQARRLRESLFEKLKVVAESTLSAGEKATQMEDLFLAEEKKQDYLIQQLKRLGDLLYKKDNELTEARTSERMTEAAINGAHNTIKNLASQMNRLDTESLKQQEIIYSQDFTLQQLERRCMRMQGEQNTEEKSNLENRITELRTELDHKDQTCAVLNSQIKKLQDDMRHATIELESYRKERKMLTTKVEELNLYSDISETEAKCIVQKKQNIMVEENLLKLKIKKLQDMLNSKADDVMSMEKRSLQLNTAMKERQLEIKIHKEMLIAQIKVTDEERQQISAELHARISKIDKMKKRYEIMTVSMAPPEGEEEKSQAYYVIKAAQEKEELQREGDNLDARIRKAEKEIQALENTLKLMNGRNEQYRKSFNKITESSTEMDEKHELNEQFRAVMDKHKYKRRQIQELQDDLHTMNATVGNLVRDEEAIKNLINEKKVTILELDRETENQKEKLERVDKQNVRLSRSLRADKKSREELPEEKDIKIRELRDFIKNIMTIIGDAAASIPEMSEVVQLYFSQANLPQLPAKSGLTNYRSPQVSSRSSLASSSKSSSRSTIASFDPAAR